jgi:hypothetical protein
VAGAFVDRADGDREIGAAGDQEPNHVGVLNADVLQQVEAVGVDAEREVADDRVERVMSSATIASLGRRV